MYSQKQLGVLNAILQGSTEPLHNHSLTILARDGLIVFTPRGNGWSITDNGIKVLNDQFDAFLVSDNNQ